MLELKFSKINSPVSFSRFSSLEIDDFNDSDFESLAIEVCTRSLENSSNLGEAFKNCEGLFPVHACHLFEKIDPKKFHFLLNSQVIEPEIMHKASFLLSQWMFSRKTSLDLMSILSSRLGTKLLLGAPSLKECLQQGDLIVDKSSVDSAYSIQCDVNHFFESGYNKCFDSILIDPPWTLAGYKDWLLIAEKYLSDTGRLYLPLLRSLTRPEANKDRSEILKFLDDIGLKAKKLDMEIEYGVPSFEAAVLEGLQVPITNWKTADLFEIRRELKPTEVTLKRTGVIPEKLVAFAVINDVRIEGCVSAIKRESAFLTCPSDGINMTSTSSRSIANRSSNVFTSNGYKFVCSNVVELISYLKSDNLEGLEQKVCNSEMFKNFKSAIY